MSYEAIERLNLKEAFSDLEVFKRIVRPEDWLDVLFEHRNRKSIFVYDCPGVGHTIFVNDTNGLGNNKVFVVQNNSNKDVFLWHIDGVLYEKHSKCDCALLTIDELDFIEFKTDAVNRTQMAITENYRKAEEQLETTVLEFKTRCARIGVDLTSAVRLKAHAVFNPTVPSNNATQKRLSVKFLSKTRVKLSFDNKMVLA